MAETQISPAEQAAIECMNNVMASLTKGNNFRVEAGAGAGKTYTLIHVLRYLVDNNGVLFQRADKRIACITFTNVAKDEILSRTDNHPAIFAETIHAFCWELIKGFQKPLRSHLNKLTDRWEKRCQETPVTNQQVKYDLGYPKLTEFEAYLHHDDVIKLMAYLLDDEKFRSIVKNRFPIILIDEYQDTSKILASSMLKNFIETKEGPQIGFFGDHWQKIYGSSSVGLIDAPADKLDVIGKNANFRSDKFIVQSLNRIRTELPQNEFDPSSTGEITILDSNNFPGTRRTENHWQEDLPADDAHRFFISAQKRLIESGWDFSPDKTKVLMLTNNLLAAEQGYLNLYRAFPDTEDLMSKNDSYIAYLSDTIYPAITTFDSGRYGEMFEQLALKSPKIKTHRDKERWFKFFKRLSEITDNQTIGDVIDFINNSDLLRLPERVFESEARLTEFLAKPVDERSEDEANFIARKQTMRGVQFQEIAAFSKYIDDQTPFSTNHGVKGAQFENVMVVLGRGWNQYNWNQMLEWSINLPVDKIDTFERNRNLFYVACSRPKKRLALVFTQKLSEDARRVLERWFATTPESLDIWKNNRTLQEP